MVPEQIIEYIKHFSLGDHIVLFYENSVFKREVLRLFVKAALQRNIEVHVYLRKRDEVNGLVEEFGFDPRLVIGDFRLVRSSAEKEEHSLQIIERICNEVKARGREGLLILGEVSGSLYADGFIQKCIEFDRSNGRRFDLPVAMVCPYDATLLKKEKWGEAFPSILKAHGHAIFPGRAFKLKWSNRDGYTRQMKGDSTFNESSECEKCKAWKRVLTQIFGSSITELLERMVEKELSSKKH